MTKSKNLLKNHNYLDITLLDVIKLLDPSGNSKYVDLLYKMGPKKVFNPQNKEEMLFKITTDVHRWGFNISQIESLSNEEIYYIIFLCGQFFNSSDISLLREYHDLCEKKLVEVTDLTKMNTFYDLANQVTLANIKKTDIEIEKLISTVYRDENWLVVRPLSHSSSLKYGATTKWCTASTGAKDYFYRYTKRGILMYMINMKTGNKTAFFYALYGEKETSFWDSADIRVDSFETDITPNILNIIKEEIKNKPFCNWDLLSSTQQNDLTMSDMNYDMKSTSMGGDIQHPQEYPIDGQPGQPVFEDRGAAQILFNDVMNIDNGDENSAFFEETDELTAVNNDNIVNISSDQRHITINVSLQDFNPPEVNAPVMMQG